MATDRSQEIRSARLARGWSQDELARRAGVSQSSIDRIERGLSNRSRFLPEVLSALELGPSIKPTEGYRPPPDFFGDRDLPVYSAAEGGPGEMVVSNEPIEIVVRPWFMKEVRDGFAVLITGESMVPAFRPGEMAIVNPRLPLVRSHDTIFASERAETGEFKATIKHLISWSQARWRVEQFNPPEGEPKEFDLDRSFWAKAWRVVGKYHRG